MDRPNPAELLAAISNNLGQLPEAPPTEARYLTKILANLCAIVTRELELRSAADAAALTAFTPLLTNEPTSAADAAKALDGALRTGEVAPNAATFNALLTDVVARLDIARPGYQHPGYQRNA